MYIDGDSKVLGGIMLQEIFMKIAVDLSFIRSDHTNGGTESCIRNLMKGWIQEGVIRQFIFFIHNDVYQDYYEEFPECEFCVYNCRGPHKIRTTWFQTMILPGWVRKYHVDVLYYPTYTMGYYVSLGIPVVVNPHDIQFKFYPEYFSLWKRWYLDFGYRHSLKRANRIIAISEYVKSTLEQFYGKECGNKITTVYDPIDFDTGAGEGPEGVICPFILSISSIQKHKNMLTLVKAFGRICHAIPHQLVIVGCKGNGMEGICQYIKQQQLEGRVLFTDYVANSEISWLYEHAALYVTTSLYEGFGMTPIEAMGRGVPVISSMSTSLPEVTMHLANYYEPAEDDIGLSAKIVDILGCSSRQIPDADMFRKRYDKKNISQKMFELFVEEFDNKACHTSERGARKL